MPTLGLAEIISILIVLGIPLAIIVWLGSFAIRTVRVSTSHLQARSARDSKPHRAALHKTGLATGGGEATSCLGTVDRGGGEELPGLGRQ